MPKGGRGSVVARALTAQVSGPGFDSRRLPGFFLFQLALGCRWGDESVCAHPC